MEVSYTIFLFESAHPWGYYNSKIPLQISFSSFFSKGIGTQCALEYLSLDIFT